MMKTVITTGTIAIAILTAIVIITVVVGPALTTEYLEFGLALLMFLVIFIGSYWFIVRGPGSRM